MKLFHGSNVEVREPKINQSRSALDFGGGFYLTSDFGQAQKWAERKVAMRQSGYACVNVFSIEESDLQSLKRLVFASADIEWLRFVVANRTGDSKVVHLDYDVISGPVADDQAAFTINNFLNGRFPEEIALQLLLPQKLKDQYVFKTEDAVRCLKFEEVL